MVYGSFIALVVCSVCFILLICFSQLVYIYLGVTFVMLLGFAFYLLKSINNSLAGMNTASIFYSDASSLLPLAYILMAVYLVLFPIVLFSPQKIKSAVKIINKLSKYFTKMSSVNLFSYLVIYVTWGLLMLEIFLLLNMFASG